jgi:hypothetical protein
LPEFFLGRFRFEGIELPQEIGVGGLELLLNGRKRPLNFSDIRGIGGMVFDGAGIQVMGAGYCQQTRDLGVLLTQLLDQLEKRLKSKVRNFGRDDDDAGPW